MAFDITPSNAFLDSPWFDAIAELGRNDGFICGNVIGKVPASLSDNCPEFSDYLRYSETIKATLLLSEN